MLFLTIAGIALGAGRHTNHSKWKTPAPTPAVGHLPCTGYSANLSVPQCHAYQDYFDSTGGPSWLACADSRTDPCNCYSGYHDVWVWCNKNYTTILRINMAENHLVGFLPWSIVAWEDVSMLFLWGNRLWGRLPELRLPSLRQCKLYRNSSDPDAWQNSFQCPLPPFAQNRTTCGMSADQCQASPPTPGPPAPGPPPGPPPGPGPGPGGGPHGVVGAGAGTIAGGVVCAAALAWALLAVQRQRRRAVAATPTKRPLLAGHATVRLGDAAAEEGGGIHIVVGGELARQGQQLPSPSSPLPGDSKYAMPVLEWPLPPSELGARRRQGAAAAAQQQQLLQQQLSSSSSSPLPMPPSPTQLTLTQLIGRREQFANASFSDESVAAARAFRPRPTDTFILTAPKTGTSWLTQVCHHLRLQERAGDMDFDDMYQMVPWTQMAADLGMSLDAEQVASPRLFKSHQRLAAIQRGAKYIVTVREPEATMKSWFEFVQAMEIPAAAGYGSVSEFVATCDEFVSDGMRFGATLWEYYAEFHAARAHPDVLVLVFEDLIRDLPAHLPLIAAHMGLPACSDAVVAEVARVSGKAFMQAHQSKFDASWAYKRMKALGKLPQEKLDCNRPAARVTARSAKEKSGLKLDGRASAFMARKWAEEVAPSTGCGSYQELADSIREECRRRRAAAHKSVPITIVPNGATL